MEFAPPLNGATRAGRDILKPGGTRTTMGETMDVWRSLALPEALRNADAHVSLRAEMPTAPGPSPTDNDALVLRARIGEGGMGVVHAAFQSGLDREVAVKQLKPDASDAAARRLTREAQIAGRLQHPNIPPVYALRVDEAGRPSVVMRRIRGVSFLELLAEADHPGWTSVSGPRDRFVVETLGAVCRALALAHSQGIVHRDIKPANIMLGDFGEVFLVDWGLAMPFEGEPQSGVVGTPAYMAPEMVAQERVGPFTDVYLVGATLYHALTGAPLHAGERFVDVVRHIVEAPPLVFDDDVSASLQDVCRRATQADPLARFPSIDALRIALQDTLHHKASLGLAASAQTRIARIHVLGADDVGRRRAVDEARFALTEAGRLWSDNPKVPLLANALRAAMIEQALTDENLRDARLLLAEAPDAHPELAERVAGLRETLAKRAARAAALEALARDRDDRVGARTRVLGITVFAVVAAAISAAMYAFRLDVGYAEMLVLHGVTIVAGLPIATYVWFHGENNRRSRQLVACAVVMVLFSPACTALGAQLDLPIVELLLVESLALAPGYVLVGIALDRRVTVGAAVVFIGVAFGLAVPAHAPLGVTMAHVGAMGAAAAALALRPVRPVTPR